MSRLNGLLPGHRGRAESLRSRRGQSMVEFALILPLLLFLAFGVMDLGRYVYVRTTLEANASRAARAMTLAENLSTDCPALRLSAIAGNAADVTVDPHSYLGNALPPSVPASNRGYVYLNPAVAPAPPPAPSLASCTSPATVSRPRGTESVTITFRFVPWTPLAADLGNNIIITTVANGQSEY